MSDCIFCKIASGDIPSNKVFENETLIAFKDIQPQAPIHILIIPKKHIATMNDVSDSDAPMMSELMFLAGNLAKELGFAEKGYRIVINCNEDGGQAVPHLHAHLLGGRAMTWPPG